MIQSYESALFIGVNPPSSRKVKGVDIWTQADAQTRALGNKICSMRLTLNPGLLGVIESLPLGGGIGRVETRAYKAISFAARESKASVAVVTAAYVESTETLPAYCVDFELHE